MSRLSAITTEALGHPSTDLAAGSFPRPTAERSMGSEAGAAEGDEGADEEARGKATPPPIGGRGVLPTERDEGDRDEKGFRNEALTLR